MATERYLISEIQAAISNSCALPEQLPEAEVRRIIHRARDWAWVNYQYAVEQKLMAIPIEIFYNPNFNKEHRAIQMPDCVVAVTEFKEINGVGIIGQPERDFSDSKLLGAEIFLSPFQGDNLVYRTAMYSYFDLAKNYMLDWIRYKFSYNTKRLTVLGRIPCASCYCTVLTKIPDESLYEDELFVRYCLAQSKIELGRILGRFGFNMPGGVTINFADIKEDGKEEMAAIKEQIDGENNPDWFLQWP